MTAIDPLAEDAVELPHARRKVALRGFDNQVVVIAHLAPGVERPVVAPTTLGKGFQPGFAVGVVVIDVLAPVAARGDVIKTAREFQSERAGYFQSLPGEDAILQDLTTTRCLPVDAYPLSVAYPLPKRLRPFLRPNVLVNGGPSR